MCVEGCVGTSTLPSLGTVPERVRQELGSFQRHVGDRTGSRMCPSGLRGFSPVQGPYCQARSNCLSSSSSASSTLGGWGSSPAMTSCSSGLPRPVPFRAGPLPLTSQLSHCSPALASDLPLPSAAKPSVGRRRHTSLPLALPMSAHVPCPLASTPPASPPHLRDLALVPASPCSVQRGPPSSSLQGRNQ